MKKNSSAKVSVVIAAAGKGTRMNMDINKQYIDVCGKPVLARTLEIFENCMEVDEIVLVTNSADIPYCKRNIVDAYNCTKVTSLIAGGDERQKSVYNGLLAVSRECDIVIIHDGARPFPGSECVVKSIQAAEENGACCIAVPVKDTIKVVGEDGMVMSTPDRRKLWAVQTPQTFKYDVIMEAHRRAEEEGFLGTDDTALVERLGMKVQVIMGSYYNIKITTKEDLAIAEAIVKGMEE